MFGCTRLTDIQALSSLAGLQSLSLASCYSRSWGAVNFGPVKFCTQLTSLDLSSNRLAVTNVSVAAFVPLLVNLENLNLSKCNDFFDLTPLSSCINLKSLDVSRTYMRVGQHSITSLVPLSLCTKLESLTLNKSTIVDLSDLLSCPRLKYLSMPSIDSLTDVSGLVTSAGSIEVLDLSGCKSVTTESLNRVLQAASRLVNLNLTACSISRISLHKATSTSLKTLCVPRSVLKLDFLSDLALLENLSLRNKSIKDLAFLTPCVNIKNLNISDCVRVGDISALISLSNLGDLNLSLIPLQNDEISVLSTCTSIKTLSLKLCSEISDIKFLSKMVKLEELSLHSLALIEDLAPLYPLRKLSMLDLRGCIGVKDLIRLRPLAKNLKKIKMDKGITAETKESGGTLIEKAITRQ